MILPTASAGFLPNGWWRRTRRPWPLRLDEPIGLQRARSWKAKTNSSFTLEIKPPSATPTISRWPVRRRFYTVRRTHGVNFQGHPGRPARTPSSTGSSRSRWSISGGNGRACRRWRSGGPPNYRGRGGNRVPPRLLADGGTVRPSPVGGWNRIHQAVQGLSMLWIDEFVDDHPADPLPLRQDNPRGELLVRGRGK